MSDPRSRFHPSELDLELDSESAELLATARDLETYAATGLAGPSVGFEDRVMAAIADEPMPRPAGRGLLATARDAWAIAFGSGRPLALRAQAFAMLLALAVAVGSVGSVAVIGASRLLGAGRDAAAHPAEPVTDPVPVGRPVPVPQHLAESVADRHARPLRRAPRRPRPMNRPAPTITGVARAAARAATTTPAQAPGAAIAPARARGAATAPARDRGATIARHRRYQGRVA